MEYLDTRQTYRELLNDPEIFMNAELHLNIRTMLITNNLRVKDVAEMMKGLSKKQRKVLDTALINIYNNNRKRRKVKKE